MFGWNGAKSQKTYKTAEPVATYGDTGAGVMSGIASGTRVGTAIGWRDVASLQVGDMVLTFDNGVQRLKGITRSQLWSGEGPCPVRFWPLMVPAGVLDNSSPMVLLGRQGVMLESDIAEERYGDPFALIPATALEGLHGIERTYPTGPIEVITLEFESEQIVFGDHGTLLFCAAGCDLIARAAAPETNGYKMLGETNACELMKQSALAIA